MHVYLQMRHRENADSYMYTDIHVQTLKALSHLLRLRETYEKRMKINEIIFIRLRIPFEMRAYE